MEVVVVQAAISPKKKLSNHLLVDLLDVKSGLGWRLVNVINRAGGVDVFWKISKNPKKSNTSTLRFLKTIKLDE